MKLNEIGRPAGAVRPPKRRGRGGASGHGGTSARGHKGQNARSGGGVRPGFEGGQMPLSRRLPKRGFTSPRVTRYRVINLDQLAAFPAGTEVDGAALAARGLARAGECVKVLSRGSVEVALNVHAAAFSRAAREKIEAAGGRAVLPEPGPAEEKKKAEGTA